MQHFKSKERIIAEQWRPGKKVKGVIDDDPWKPSGSYMDRFTDRADVYVKIDGEEKSVRDGDWIVYDNFGNVIDVYSDEYVTQHFEAA